MLTDGTGSHMKNSSYTIPKEDAKSRYTPPESIYTDFLIGGGANDLAADFVEDVIEQVFDTKLSENEKFILGLGVSVPKRAFGRLGTSHELLSMSDNAAAISRQTLTRYPFGFGGASPSSMLAGILRHRSKPLYKILVRDIHDHTLTMLLYKIVQDHYNSMCEKLTGLCKDKDSVSDLDPSTFDKEIGEDTYSRFLHDEHYNFMMDSSLDEIESPKIEDIEIIDDADPDSINPTLTDKHDREVDDHTKDGHADADPQSPGAKDPEGSDGHTA